MACALSRRRYRRDARMVHGTLGTHGVEGPERLIPQRLLPRLPSKRNARPLFGKRIDTFQHVRVRLDHAMRRDPRCVIPQEAVDDAQTVAHVQHP